MKYLVGTSGVHIRQEIPLDNEVIIGRDSSICQLIYPSQDKGVSGVHCKIKCIGDKVQLIDMGSTNGTFLDSGIRLTPNVPQVIEAGQGFYLSDRGNAYVIRDDAQSGSSKSTSANKNNSKNGNAANSVSPAKSERTGAIGFSIACFVVGIIALLVGIISKLESFTYIPAIALGVISLGLGITALTIRAKGLAMTVVGVVCSAITVIGLVALLLIPTGPKDIVGTWYLSDSSNVRQALIRAIEDGMDKVDMDSRLAEVLVNETNMDNDILFTFSDTGNIYIGDTSGLNITLGIITWEDTQDGYLRIALDLKDVEVFGNSVPIEIGYRSKYELTDHGDTLNMDFFGANIVLERQKEEESDK